MLYTQHAHAPPLTSLMTLGSRDPIFDHLDPTDLFLTSIVSTLFNQIIILHIVAEYSTESFTPTSKVSWKVEAFSLCMFLLLPTLREVPHGTKGTGPKFVMRPVYWRSQLQDQQEHSFCSSSTNAFISCSLYTVHRYCTSPGAPDLRVGLG